jgi:hypothetical protein
MPGAVVSKTGGELGKGRPVGARELDAAILDEGARRGGADAGDDPVAAYALLAVAGVEDCPAGLDRLGLGLVADGEAAVGIVLDQRLGVGLLGGGEAFAHVRRAGLAVEDGDDIALRRILGERAGILDPRVAGADDEDMLVENRIRVVELVGDVRQVAAGAAHQVRIALRADGEDDVLGDDRLAAGHDDFVGRRVTLDFLRRRRAVPRPRDDLLDRAFDRRAGAADRLHLGVQHHVDLVLGRHPVPGAEDRLALAGFEIHVRAQHELARRRHDVLALLIFVDGVGKVVGLFEQHVGQAELRRARGGAEAGRTRADDRDPERSRHVPPVPHVRIPGAV